MYTRTPYVPNSREPDTILTVERKELANTQKECMHSTHLQILRYTSEGIYNIRVFILLILQYYFLRNITIRTKYEVYTQGNTMFLGPSRALITHRPHRSRRVLLHLAPDFREEIYGLDYRTMPAPTTRLEPKIPGTAIREAPKYTRCYRGDEYKYVYRKTSKGNGLLRLRRGAPSMRYILGSRG